MTFKFKWQPPNLSHRTNDLSQKIGVPIDAWQGRENPPQTIMSGKYCMVVPFDPRQHGDDLFEAFSKDTASHNWTYLPYGPFEQKQDFIHWCENVCCDKDPMFHTVVDSSTGRAIGMASYLRITPDAGVIEVGHIHFSPLMQGTTQATEAMFLMMRRVFDELGYRRYEWKCDALNSPSCKAAERLGFQFEGIFRNATIYKQRNRDTAWFAIIDSDWPTLKTGYEAWLTKENFNNKGQQIKSLKQCISNIP